MAECHDAGWAGVAHEEAAYCVPCYLLLRDRMFWAEAEVIRLGGKVRPVEDYLCGDCTRNPGLCSTHNPGYGSGG